MAELFGKNATKTDVSVPSELINVNEASGRVRRAYDEYTLDGELALNDTVQFMKIPSGAKIIDARFVSPDLGTTGVFDIGYASDTNALFGALDATGALDAKMLGTVAAYELELATEETIILTATTATDAGDALKISLEVFYVLD